jgi:D-lactate dehydrogenase (cytochrome)
MSYLRSTYRVVTRHPRGSSIPVSKGITDADRLEAILHDAAHYPGGYVSLLIQPRDEAELAHAVRRYPRILVVGAQSSLTGGAMPRGEVVMSLAHFKDILEIGHDRVRVQAGLSLRKLRERLAQEDKHYPPVPSYDGATVGGTIATNAAGPATFKYGSTRAWVQAITVVLASGEVLDLERGQCFAHPDGYFEIESTAGVARIPLPTYRVPPVPKCSAGYYAAPGMDLIDLFIGSEGTLGIITEATLRMVAPAPAICIALVPCTTEAQALDITQKLRASALETRRTHNRQGLDVSAIEYLDTRSLQIVCEDGSDRRYGFTFASTTRSLLLVQIELPPEYVDRAYDDLAEALEAGAPDVPLVALVRLLEAADVLQDTELVMPTDRSRAEQVQALREAIPDGVNARVLKSKRERDIEITKVGADMIVPFEHLQEMMQLFRASFEQCGLDYAIWGHISDGNMHPNLLPRTFEEVKAAQEAVLACGRIVTALGGCPLAEHGVGRNTIKKTLLRHLYGETGYKQMYAVKQALDPTWKLAPGNLFSSMPSE